MDSYTIESFIQWCDDVKITPADEGLFFNKKKENNDQPKLKPIDSATINKVKTEAQKTIKRV